MHYTVVKHDRRLRPEPGEKEEGKNGKQVFS